MPARQSVWNQEYAGQDQQQQASEISQHGGVGAFHNISSESLSIEGHFSVAPCRCLALREARASGGMIPRRRYARDGMMLPDMHSPSWYWTCPPIKSFLDVNAPLALYYTRVACPSHIDSMKWGDIQLRKYQMQEPAH
jgi:hypothetical protein